MMEAPLEQLSVGLTVQAEERSRRSAPSWRSDEARREASAERDERPAGSFVIEIDLVGDAAVDG